jgi:integrase
MKNGITKRGSTYSYVVRIPDLKTGKTKPHWVSGFKTEIEAKNARDKARVAATNGTYISPSKVLVGDFLKEWVGVHAQTLKPKTADDYERMINSYINPRIGKLALSRLRPVDIAKMYRELTESGGANGEKLSGRTVAYVGAVLKNALAYAVDVESIIPKNVAKGVPVPKNEKKVNEPFSPEQVRYFLSASKTHRLYALFRLAVYTGARKGELLALKWSDLDFEQQSLVISKNRLVVRGENVVQASTKGGEGRRIISLDPETVEIMKDHRKRQFEERLKAGSLWNETGYVFATEFGEPINYGTPTQLFTKIKNRLNLPDQRFHDLRHFHATQLLKAGTPLHVVAHRLGHRDPMVTATTYAHVTADQAVNVSVVFAKAVE